MWDGKHLVQVYIGIMLIGIFLIELGIFTRVKLGTKTGATFQYSLFKGFYVTKKYHINIYYKKFKLFIHVGYIDIKIDN